MDIELIENKEEKIELAKKILNKIEQNMTIGFGSGSTSYLTAIEIGKYIKEKNIKISAVPTSSYIADICKKYGIEIVNITSKKLDFSFDGADEIDLEKNMIKGYGKAMFKEKLNMKNSKKTYILADKTKFVEKLGQTKYVPIEVFIGAENYVAEKLEELGATEIIFVGETENENSVFHVKFEDITKKLEDDIKLITGVIESGLFMDYDVEIITN